MFWVLDGVFFISAASRFLPSRFCLHHNIRPPLLPLHYFTCVIASNNNMTMKAIHLLRRVALRSHGRPSLPASSCRAFSVVPEAPQSAMDGSDKSLNRITRTESMVSLIAVTAICHPALTQCISRPYLCTCITMICPHFVSIELSHLVHLLFFI